jgi:hypothetical protein
MAEMDQAIGTPAFTRLHDEWAECFQEGVITADEIGPDDRRIDYDDSREATARWVERILAMRVGRHIWDGEVGQ